MLISRYGHINRGIIKNHNSRMNLLTTRRFAFSIPVMCSCCATAPGTSFVHSLKILTNWQCPFHCVYVCLSVDPAGRTVVCSRGDRGWRLVSSPCWTDTHTLKMRKGLALRLLSSTHIVRSHFLRTSCQRYNPWCTTHNPGLRSQCPILILLSMSSHITECEKRSSVALMSFGDLHTAFKSQS